MPFFQHDDNSFFYTDEGTGQPILLLHGWACDSHDWSFQIPVLLGLGLRVIALDHRGHGRSSAPTSTEAYKLRTLASDVLALLSHLQTGPVILAGHSMSTVISSIIAAEHPETVRALIIVHPIYSGASPKLPLVAEQMRQYPDQINQICVDLFHKIMWAPRAPEWIKTWVRRRNLGNSPHMILGCLEGCVELAGSVFGQTEEAKALMLKRKAPRLAITTMEAAPVWEKELGLRDGVDEVHHLDEGTFVHMIRPEEVNALIINWLEKSGLC